MNQNTQNGRVTIQNLNQFMLFDKIPINNKTTEYRNPTTGIWEESELSKLFFSIPLDLYKPLPNSCISKRLASYSTFKLL